ncbi:TPA: hypothetical protein ACPVYZ_004249 [Vibrio parahaemolyticus]|uniref:hypothetical protein n=1 Tax=Vibrio parahaemolyticus TaxID=670 RepID=UPI001121AF69|nr:hypothetical protein [Vibrio parahaemolyticus]MBE4286404.1 hypothetical protein [Vibrio parahaemolyticus]TOH19160.1 hypothetical protein CGI90_04045 [Vibrio parahaemolyticus]HCG7330444.1 hypothetical protein [Vibrio parahaemolyticus]HCG9589023.1 hypothetical protein [Vibrio parahaemolyticus]HCM0798097.1 hypothetical protein [Vibrio parahaemolyticus]
MSKEVWLGTGDVPASIELTVSLIVDAIIGKGFLSIYDGEHFVEMCLAERTGNQHNFDWKWKRKELERLSLDMLLKIYNRKG